MLRQNRLTRKTSRVNIAVSTSLPSATSLGIADCITNVASLGRLTRNARATMHPILGNGKMVNLIRAQGGKNVKTGMS